MLRVRELKLGLDHSDADLRQAVARRLSVDDAALLDLRVARRGHDARRRSDIALIYTVDAEMADEAAVLRRVGADRPCTRRPTELPLRRPCPGGASRRARW